MGAKVLVIEDDRSLNLPIPAQLKESGYDVADVSGVPEALATPFSETGLQSAARGALARSYMPKGSPAAANGFSSISGRSASLQGLLDAAERVSGTDVTVLIHGETGTGKELLAREIHLNSGRRTKPFVVINCGAIPRELLESELFGYVRGAFTGALAHKKGKVELAHGGTVFFDEIGELPPELQVRLLRLVQEREIEKVGAANPSKVDIRIIAATNRNLREMVESGVFRKDLYYRLAVVPLELPPLRERTEDIPSFVRAFFERSREKFGVDIALPARLLSYFTGYGWPGNLRELENTIERIVVLCRSREVGLDDLPEYLRKCAPAEPAGFRVPVDLSLGDIEKEVIIQALRKADGNQSAAARGLRITRKALICRMARHGIRQNHRQPRRGRTAILPPPSGSVEAV